MGCYGMNCVHPIDRYGMVSRFELPYHYRMIWDFSGIIPWDGTSLGYTMGFQGGIWYLQVDKIRLCSTGAR